MRHRRRSWGCSRAPRCSAAAGCGDDGPETPSDPSGPSGRLRARRRNRRRRGAARGSARRTASLTVGNVDAQQSEFELADSELERLTAELEAAEFDEVGSDGPDACADCFIDRITYEGESTTILPEVDDVPDSVDAVLTELRGLVEST